MEKTTNDGLQQFADLQLSAAQAGKIKGGTSDAGTDADGADIVIVDLIAP